MKGKRISLLLTFLCLITSGGCQRHGVEASGGSSTPAPVSSLALAEKDFLVQAAKTATLESSLSRVAANRSLDPCMKEYARTIVDNQTCILKNLDDLMDRKGLGPQTSVGEANVEGTYGLDSVFGNALDYKYIVRMVAETGQALEAYERAAKEAEDQEVRHHAAATISVLECEYQTAADLERELVTRP